MSYNESKKDTSKCIADEMLKKLEIEKTAPAVVLTELLKGTKDKK